jgi:DNA-binding response OmpR family regulator
MARLEGLQMVGLTKTEMAIVACLERHAGLYVTAAVLAVEALGFAYVGGLDAKAQPGLFRAHVSNIRRKFRESNAAFAIETRYQLGYRLLTLSAPAAAVAAGSMTLSTVPVERSAALSHAPYGLAAAGS